MLQYFQKKAHKNHPQKLLRKTQIHFFSLLPWAAQMAQTEEFMFQNVAYRPTVYRTGAFSMFPMLGTNLCLKAAWGRQKRQVCKIDANDYFLVIRITWFGIRINKVLTRVVCSIEAVKDRVSQPYDLIGFQSCLRDIRALFLSLCT